MRFSFGCKEACEFTLSIQRLAGYSTLLPKTTRLPLYLHRLSLARLTDGPTILVYASPREKPASAPAACHWTAVINYWHFGDFY